MFVGALLCNSIPHLTAGLQGTAFPTPFAKPRGIGDSSPFVNFLWGTFNAVAGITLLAHRPVTIGVNLDCLWLFIGLFVPGSYLSLHFGKVRASAPRR